jgi:hypothetical protein
LCRQKLIFLEVEMGAGDDDNDDDEEEEEEEEDALGI